MLKNKKIDFTCTKATALKWKKNKKEQKINVKKTNN